MECLTASTHLRVWERDRNMRISLSNLKVGMTIWTVHLFPDARRIKNTWIEPNEVLAFPITMPGGHENFIALRRGDITVKGNFGTQEWETAPSRNAGLQSQHSMQDMGIIPNTYNNHATFSNLKSAQECACHFYKISFADPNDKSLAYNRAMKALDL